ncbi:hypothetical protein CE91St58_18240 [Lachnospiraceae bacterium]|nr:hypothetical protein CE91St56_29090 [Lachnospiraceae bacterium]GKH41855.1 hypothetical protein CE91St57_28290 [Lachnospiraceae bacterium]GKH54439.1 hypothetical protein CE91St58_18240 [Lachnospiraceae bacterium]
MDQLHGCPSGTDGHFPEEWIMSVVTARNAGQGEQVDEGLSHIMEEPEKSLKQILDNMK